MPLRTFLTSAALALFLLLVPSTSSAATIEELEARIQQLTQQLAALQAEQSADTSCVVLSQRLALGSTDASTYGEVSRLQTFLGMSATGTFDAATQTRVQQWQAQNGVVAEGTPETTGYGVVGPRTRDAMARGCAGTPARPVRSELENTPMTTTATSSPATTTKTLPPIKVEVGMDEIKYEDRALKMGGKAQGLTKFAIYMKKGAKIYGSRSEEVKVVDGRWFYEFEIPIEKGTYHVYVTKGGDVLHYETFDITQQILDEL